MNRGFLPQASGNEKSVGTIELKRELPALPTGGNVMPYPVTRQRRPNCTWTKVS
jgi:hypothetical protein